MADSTSPVKALDTADVPDADCSIAMTESDALATHPQALVDADVAVAVWCVVEPGDGSSPDAGSQ